MAYKSSCLVLLLLLVTGILSEDDTNCTNGEYEAVDRDSYANSNYDGNFYEVLVCDNGTLYPICYNETGENVTSHELIADIVCNERGFLYSMVMEEPYTNGSGIYDLYCNDDVTSISECNYSIEECNSSALLLCLNQAPPPIACPNNEVLVDDMEFNNDNSQLYFDLLVCVDGILAPFCYEEGERDFLAGMADYYCEEEGYFGSTFATQGSLLIGDAITDAYCSSSVGLSDCNYTLAAECQYTTRFRCERDVAPTTATERDNAVVVTLMGVTTDEFDNELRGGFISATVMAIERYCNRNPDRCASSSRKRAVTDLEKHQFKRQFSTVTANDIVITNIEDGSEGLLVTFFVRGDANNTVIPGEAVIEAVRDASDIYSDVGITISNIMLLMEPPTEEDDGLSGGAIAGIVVAVVVVVAILLIAIIAIIAFCYCIRFKKNTKEDDVAMKKLSYGKNDDGKSD